MAGSRDLDELKSHYPGKNLSDLVPTQLADRLTNGPAMRQGDKFCLAKYIEGLVLVDKDGKDILGGKGNRMPIARKTSTGGAFRGTRESSARDGLHSTLEQ